MNKLNKEQAEAVQRKEGYTRIIAGPGTGKTRTLTEKIKHLIEEGVEPWNILALTFTNKAAQEMKQRTNELLGYETKVNFFTFHGLCNYMLKVTGADIELERNFTILDVNDQKSILKKFYKELQVSSKEISYYDSLNYIESKKLKREESESNTVQDLIQNEIFSKIYSMYIEYQKTNQILDFNDLIIYTVKMLKESASANKYWSNKYQYILVDEFQDTDYDQYEIVKQLSKNSKSLTVVGDPDQTIYSWRGAKIEIINNFHNDFPETKTIKLIQNYRSTQEIVSLSNKSIKYNRNRIDKELVSLNETGNKVELYDSYYDQYGEPKFIHRKMQQLIRNKGYSNSDFAILYRNNFISSKFEIYFAQRGIQYDVIGSFKFWSRKEVKEVVSYLSWVFKNDNTSFENIANVPSRKFGDVAMSKLTEKANSNNNSYMNALISDCPNNLSILYTSTEKYGRILRDSKVEDFEKLFKEYLASVGFMEYYENNEDKIGNINEALSHISQYIKRNYASLSVDLSELVNEFLNYISLQSSADGEESKDAIKMMTLHNSKGREFPVVFIVGLNDEVLPSRQSIESKLNSKIEEERRLFYVGMTRAKKYLFLSYTSAPTASHFSTKRSRFINEISTHLSKSDFETPGSSYVNDNYNHNYEASKHFKQVQENKIISEGDIIEHDIFGEGVVVRDLGEYIEVAFSYKYGTKTLLKGHNKIKLIK